MKSLSMFLESRMADEILIKSNVTNDVVDYDYIAYDKESLDDIIQKHKLSKQQFSQASIFFTTQKNNKYWVAHTDVDYQMDISRMQDKFIYSDKVEYSYDDIIDLLDDGMMILFIL